MTKDRNIVIYDKDGFLQMLPKYLYKALLVGFIYDDVYSDFRMFFRPDMYLDTTMLEEIAFGLKPRFIQGSGNVATDNEQHSQSSTRALIYKEGEEVQEIFFIC